MPSTTTNRRDDVSGRFTTSCGVCCQPVSAGTRRWLNSGFAMMCFFLSRSNIWHPPANCSTVLQALTRDVKRLQFVPSDPVREFLWMRDVPGREIGAFSDFDRASIVEAERLCGMDGCTGETLFGGQPEQARGECHGSADRANRRCAGVTVSGDCDGNAVRAKCLDRRQLCLTQCQESAG